MATSLSLSQRSQLDGIVQKMQANGETDDYIQGVVNDFKTKYAGPLPDGMRAAPTSPSFLSPQGAQLYESLGSPDIGRMVAGALPTAGGILGGIGGGLAGAAATPYLGFSGAIPGAIAGAGAGGALGETGREALLGEQLDPRRIATMGALEGGSQALGGPIVKGAGKASGFLARRALALAEKKGGGGLMDIGMGTLIGNTFGHGAQGAAAGAARAAAQSPMVNRGLAKLVGSLAFKRLARQSPRAAAAMVQQYLSAEPDATRQQE